MPQTEHQLELDLDYQNSEGIDKWAKWEYIHKDEGRTDPLDVCFSEEPRTLVTRSCSEYDEECEACQ